MVYGEVGDMVYMRVKLGVFIGQGVLMRLVMRVGM